MPFETVKQFSCLRNIAMGMKLIQRVLQKHPHSLSGNKLKFVSARLNDDGLRL